MIWAHLIFSYVDASNVYAVGVLDGDDLIVRILVSAAVMGANLDNWFMSGTTFDIAAKRMCSLAEVILSSSCEIRRIVLYCTAQSHICIERNITFKLKRANNFGIFGFHSL
jgi:hypothetical protein